MPIEIDRNGIQRLLAEGVQLVDALPAEEVMEAGPSTIRRDRRLADVVEQMRAKNIQNVVVTTSDGRLVGLLNRESAESGLGT